MTSAGRLICGIDPGQSGGIAFIDTAPSHSYMAYPMPDTERDVFELLDEHAASIEVAIIEAVHSMPKQGVASSFKFGMSYGFLRGILIALRIPFKEISPQKWTKTLGLVGGAPGTGKKNKHKAAAQQWFPHVKLTHATADALLIAEAGRRLRVCP